MRAHFGNIRHLPSGRWQARYKKDGVWHNASETFRTKGEAQAWMATVQADIVRGLWTYPRAGEVTLNDYARTWLAQRHDLRPRTREVYDALLRLCVLPGLGGTEISRIKRPDVRAWHSAVAKERTPGQAAKAYRLLRTVLGTAAADGLIPANPCTIRGAGTEHTPERQIPSLVTVNAIAERLDGRYNALVLTAALAGLRLGELSALERRDVDLLHRTIKVNRQAQDVFGLGRIVGPPKSAAGSRVVAVPPSLVVTLDDHLATYVASEPGALVFTMDKGEPLVRARWDARFRRAADDAGAVHLHFHDLRHLAGTLAAATGASTREIMSRLGHSTARVALIYQHATAERDHGIAAGIEAIIVAAAEQKPAQVTELTR